MEIIRNNIISDISQVFYTDRNIMSACLKMYQTVAQTYNTNVNKVIDKPLKTCDFSVITFL